MIERGSEVVDDFAHQHPPARERGLAVDVDADPDAVLTRKAEPEVPSLADCLDLPRKSVS
jgi:hypothetical protein